MYSFFRQLLFLLPAEQAHYVAMNFLKVLCSVPFLEKSLQKWFQPNDEKSLKTNLYNLEFKNPVGLAAGFDKNAKYLREIRTLGFAFVEIGTVTPKPQMGNPKPRLFRLPKDKALINRMGFNNDGVEVVAERLRKWRENEVRSTNSELGIFLIGGNIGKNKITSNEDAWKDYEICFNALHSLVDFFVVNVSSPNTPGLRELQEKESLMKILVHLQNLNKNFDTQKPLLLKIAPDLSLEQIDDVISLSLEINLDGLVAANTTISRENLFTTKNEVEEIGAGGLSGKPLKSRSTEVVKYINQKTNGIIPVIGSGGIFTAEDATEKLTSGASLIEVWTGFIYKGPTIVRDICNKLSLSK
ncbi:MAG: quinone-dependent dihydroorotate dehydrogenase [Chitinophagaceae bacterium]